MRKAKAIDVANELRKLADGIATLGELEIASPFVHLMQQDREPFLALTKVLPRPFDKEVSSPGTDYAELRLKHSSDALSVWLTVPQSTTCKLIEPARPAVYECPSLLSPEEEAELEVSAA